MTGTAGVANGATEVETGRWQQDGWQEGAHVCGQGLGH